MDKKLAKNIFFSVICSLLLLGSVLGVVFGIIQRPDTSAFNSTYTETDNAVVVSEIWKGYGYGYAYASPFDPTNTKKFIQMLANSDTGTVDTISNNIGSGTINATTLRGYSNAGNASGKSIVVTLGGFKWIVTYLFKDSDGNTCATLWMADADANGTRTYGNSSSYYGTNDWSTASDNYPASMYGISYIATTTLNNGGPYLKITSNSDNPTSISGSATSSSTHQYAAFTHSSGGIRPYIVQPNYVPYQTTSQGENNPEGFVLMNESLATSLTGYYSSYQTLTGYTNWGDDYLWLPSLSETGWTGTGDGIWQTSQAERVNSNTYSWTRSCSPYDSRSMYSLYSSGNDYNEGFVSYSYAIRPALHLNLSMIADLFLDISFDSKGGALTGSDIKTVMVDEYFNLPNVEKTGYSAQWIGESIPTGNAISTPQQLANIANDLTGSYYLTNDIDMSSYGEWTAIGYTYGDFEEYSGREYEGNFSGTLDGRGYAIKNLTLANNGMRALFVSLSGATIKNLKLDNVTISGGSYTDYYTEFAAGIASCAYDTNIINCQLSGTAQHGMSSRDNYCHYGGVVGYADNCIFRNITNNIPIYGTGDDLTLLEIGGIVGSEVECLIISCVNTADITESGTNAFLGGIVGESYYGAISNCYNLGDIVVLSNSDSSTENIGGITGEGEIESLINCFNAGNIISLSTNTELGQLSGSGDVDNFTNCYYLSTALGTAQGTEVADIATLASNFYNNLSAEEKTNWSYIAGSYPTINVTIERVYVNLNIGDRIQCGGGNFSTEYIAQYTVNTYTLALNGNGASNTVANQSITFGTGKTITNSFVRTGYTFSGWSTSASGSAAYSNGVNFDTLPVGANNNGAKITLYAVWTANTYTVVYNANGGSGTMANSTHTYDVAKNLTTNSYTRSGYKFLGWSTSNSATTATYADGESVTNLTTSGNFTLYAVWKLNILLTVLCNNDSFGTVTGGGYYEPGEQVVLGALGKVGYSLLYWQELDSNGNELSKYTDNPLTITMTQVARTFKAIFGKSVDGVVVTSTIGGTAKILGDNFSELLDTDTVIVVADIALEGYKFDGWYIFGEEECLSTEMSEKLVVGDIRDRILVAKFSPSTNTSVNQDTSN